MQELQMIYVKEEDEFYFFKNHKTLDQLNVMFNNGYQEYYVTTDENNYVIENTFNSDFNGTKLR